MTGNEGPVHEILGGRVEDSMSMPGRGLDFTSYERLGPETAPRVFAGTHSDAECREKED
jgi:hypothetical protein